MMARFIAQERLSEPSSLSRFTLGGYALVEDDSTVERPVYRRIQPPPPGR
jgi:cytoplasmic iron level regulating protein YaaA (DUF328/UPF0246 family)